MFFHGSLGSFHHLKMLKNALRCLTKLKYEKSYFITSAVSIKVINSPNYDITKKKFKLMDNFSTLNPIDTGIFFDACVPGGCEKSHPPQNQFCFYKTTFFLHEVKFCINSALFLCTVLFSSSILMNFSDFG